MSIVGTNRDPTLKQLNQFGLIWMGFLTIFGAVAWFRLGSPALAKGLWVAAVVVPAIGWLAPSFMRFVFLGMSYAGWPVGFVVSHVVLAVVYYMVVTPIGLTMRLFGYDPMTRRRDPGAESFWVPRGEDDRGPESYFRQF